MNIRQQQEIWQSLRLHIPMLICAAWVVTNQKKIIWNTLKGWWSQQWRDWWTWSKEKIKWLSIFLLWAACLIFVLSTSGIRQKLVKKQSREVMARALEEKLITEKELVQGIQKEEQEKANQEARKRKVPLPFYDISPLLCFIFVCLIAPLGEECVFRYLIFKIFGKRNPFSYILSAIGFIFLHWLGPAQGILNFTTIQILLLTYLPMTIIFIYSYRISEWNITYPIYFHFFWNFFLFVLLSFSA